MFSVTVLYLGKTLSVFALLHFVLHDQTFPLLQVSLDFLLLHSIPYDEKAIFLVLVLEGLVGHYRIIHLQLLQHYCLGHRLDYCNIEWFALEMKRNHSVFFEIAPKYCIQTFFFFF